LDRSFRDHHTGLRQAASRLDPCDPSGQPLLLVSSLDARLSQQLAVLLLRHPLAPLLDYWAHGTTLDRYPRRAACL